MRIVELLTETLDLVRPLAAKADIHLLALTPGVAAGYVLADRQRLKQVLLNLLSNAVKYNRRGGTVAISCHPAGSGRMHIEVADTSPGIRPEHQPLLFTPFERLGAEQAGVEGTGIGLALSHRLAEAMGGSLDVTTAVGQGSTFRVELPTAEGPVERYERLTGGIRCRTPTVVPGHRGTVPHVEDNLANLKLVEWILAQRPGIEVVGAMHGSPRFGTGAGPPAPARTARPPPHRPGRRRGPPLSA